MLCGESCVFELSGRMMFDGTSGKKHYTHTNHLPCLKLEKPALYQHRHNIQSCKALPRAPFPRIQAFESPPVLPATNMTDFGQIEITLTYSITSIGLASVHETVSLQGRFISPTRIGRRPMNISTSLRSLGRTALGFGAS